MIDIFELVRIFWAVAGILAAVVVGAISLYVLIVLAVTLISGFIDNCREKERSSR